jgi:hypothetical protein
VVPTTNPVMLLVNDAVVPLFVIELAVVGLAVVLQQTPTALNADKPMSVTVPPELAELELMAVMAVVATTGAPTVVVKLSSFP